MANMELERQTSVVAFVEMQSAYTTLVITNTVFQQISLIGCCIVVLIETLDEGLQFKTAIFKNFFALWCLIYKFIQ